MCPSAPVSLLRHHKEKGRSKPSSHSTAQLDVGSNLPFFPLQLHSQDSLLKSSELDFIHSGFTASITALTCQSAATHSSHPHQPLDFLCAPPGSWRCSSCKLDTLVLFFWGGVVFVFNLFNNLPFWLLTVSISVVGFRSAIYCLIILFVFNIFPFI
jgi:hypothetical protein